MQRPVNDKRDRHNPSADEDPENAGDKLCRRQRFPMFVREYRRHDSAAALTSSSLSSVSCATEAPDVCSGWECVRARLRRWLQISSHSVIPGRCAAGEVAQAKPIRNQQLPSSMVFVVRGLLCFFCWSGWLKTIAMMHFRAACATRGPCESCSSTQRFVSSFNVFSPKLKP